MFLREAIRHSC